ncbi:hypothetical protein CDL15_Pgr024857 [Punica granatum]|uniref:Uncharacterized protein n=1 Tax=Punica granatum TaxID=22663 RepID=A0A218Y2N1_PUNGR|nr:hypothetical protein CDL15_Pgr024857 [Punica granatum]
MRVRSAREGRWSVGEGRRSVAKEVRVRSISTNGGRTDREGDGKYQTPERPVSSDRRSDLVWEHSKT